MHGRYGGIFSYAAKPSLLPRFPALLHEYSYYVFFFCSGPYRHLFRSSVICGTAQRQELRREVKSNVGVGGYHTGSTVHIFLNWNDMEYAA